MWLHFRVTDSDNRVVFESGKPMPDGSITGADNDMDQAVFEPHYDRITSPEQVRIYEPVVHDTEGKISYTPLRAAGYLKDNRLTPRGFDKNSVQQDVAVVGEAMKDASFNQGVDEVTYRFSKTGEGDLRVMVALYYQPLAHGLLQNRFADSNLQQVRSFEAMYAEQALKYEQMARVEEIVQVADTDMQGDISTNNTGTSGGGAPAGLPLLLFLCLAGMLGAAGTKRAGFVCLASRRGL